MKEEKQEQQWTGWVRPLTSYFGQHGCFNVGQSYCVTQDRIDLINKELNAKRKLMPKEERHLLPSFKFEIIPAPWDAHKDPVQQQLASLQAQAQSLQAKLNTAVRARDKELDRQTQLMAAQQATRQKLAAAEEVDEEFMVKYLTMDADRLGHEIDASIIQASMHEMQVDLIADQLDKTKVQIELLKPKKETYAADAAQQAAQAGPDQGPAEGTAETATQAG